MLCQLLIDSEIATQLSTFKHNYIVYTNKIQLLHFFSLDKYFFKVKHN